MNPVSTKMTFRAVIQLSQYTENDVTELLLKIALSGEFGHRLRVIAIESMYKRGGEEEAAALASLIQPHQSLDLRRAVAQTIEGMPCNDRCVAASLHYLERISLGQQNYED